jgi:prepilin-type N-terminal cleavage/methylation domain-containing protein
MSKKGLSLMEVLVAVTIFSFTLLALFLLLRTGIFVRDKIEIKQTRLLNTYLSLENIAKELRNSVSFYDEDTGFKAAAGILEFYSVAFDYSVDSSQVSYISYSFSDGELLKTVKDPLTMEIVKEFNFLEDLESANFFYFNIDTQEWQDNWDDIETLPYGVKLELSYKEKNGEVLTLDKYARIQR